MEEKKLGLRNVISVSVGLVIATSTLVQLGQGAGQAGIMFIPAMVIACLFNMITMATLSELNSIMPNVTGGLAQYTLAGIGPIPTIVLMVGGYMVSNILSCGVEASIFAYAMGSVLKLPIPNYFWVVLASVIILIANLRGVDMFAKIQDLVSYLMLGSMLVMGILGALKLGTGKIIDQPLVVGQQTPLSIVSLTAIGFWLFIGAEYAIPISKDVKNAKRNVPLGMFMGLGIICIVQAIMIFGFHNYTNWNDLMNSAAPHLLYGESLYGKVGQIWMCIVSGLAVVSTQNSTVQGLSAIFAGMSHTNLMPQFFGKTNKNKVPFIGCWIITIGIMICALISQNSSDRISFLIQVGSVFWMASYAVANIDLLIFRYRLPKAPRNFKVPLGPVLPCVSIAGIIFIIANISTDAVERNQILGVTAVITAILFIYSIFWIKFKMKIPLFKPVPMEKVLAMENPMYYRIRKVRGIWK